MGEARKTQAHKVSALIEQLNAKNQQLYLSVAEVAIYRAMAGPLDNGLYQSIMNKLANQEWTSLESFFNAVQNAAKERMLELDVAEEHQATAARPANAIESLLSEVSTQDTSTPNAED